MFWQKDSTKNSRNALSSNGKEADHTSKYSSVQSLMYGTKKSVISSWSCEHRFRFRDSKPFIEFFIYPITFNILPLSLFTQFDAYFSVLRFVLLRYELPVGHSYCFQISTLVCSCIFSVCKHAYHNTSQRFAVLLLAAPPFVLVQSQLSLFLSRFSASHEGCEQIRGKVVCGAWQNDRRLRFNDMISSVTMASAGCTISHR
jgi:hypothetical protein